MSLDFRTFQSAGKISSHIIPGAYSRIDSVMGAGGLASASNGVIMGRSSGGEPVKLLQFNTISDAVATLRGGELMEAVRMAFDPGGGYNPQRIFAVRVNPATQATKNLLGASTNPMILLTSRDYGLYTNQIRVQVEAGSVSGKKVTVSFQNQTPEVLDNISRGAFTIQYITGASTITIANSSVAKTLVTSVGGISLALADYATIGELAAYINAQTGFTCTPVAGQENASPLELDAVTGQDIYTAPYTTRSDLQAMADMINSASVLVSASVVNAAVDRQVVANMAAAEFLTGAVEGAYTGTEWSAALTMLESEDVQFVSTPSTDAAVHATIKTHCALMSNVSNRRERQFLLGAPWKTSSSVGTEIALAVSAAQSLNSFNGMYVFNGGRARNVDGVITNYPASYAACMLMGIACASAINNPLTFKDLNFIDLEWNMSESQVESALKEGVAVVNYAPTGVPRLVRQFNTYQTNDLKYNEFSSVREMFFASRDLRNFLEARYVGKPGTSVVGGALRASVEGRLALYERIGIFIRNPAEGRSWWNVVINMSGDTVLVDYDAYITLPVNFIFVTSHFHEMVAVL
jgi:hypothetical protein